MTKKKYLIDCYECKEEINVDDAYECNECYFQFCEECMEDEEICKGCAEND